MKRLGIIGMSPGNAHPYSWSSIINGKFDAEEITRIGFPAVAAYLQANRDTLGIPGANVNCVWTQDREISESIAKSGGIEHVVDSLEDMIPYVDAVLLSRDDPENHVRMAEPFIQAGIPIFIDKPLAGSKEDLDYFAGQVAEGKFIMSCSSLRFANEARIAKQELSSIGKVELVTSVCVKDWLKYGVHVLEGVVAFLNDPSPVYVQSIGQDGKDIVYVEYENDVRVTLHLFKNICGTIQFSVYGRNGWRLVDVRNSYSQFRDTIIEFIRSLEEGRPRVSFDKTENIIRVVLAAMESSRNGGAKIDMANFK